ncbi:MAG: hypothetical protein HYS07_10150 [Chlamydiae bacterium]|nr:hypothetical protein [Chlamydiota bacterium]MBI3277027.1 hypothetical protein [Chlamydiota bacterium]
MKNDQKEKLLKMEETLWSSVKKTSIIFPEEGFETRVMRRIRVASGEVSSNFLELLGERAWRMVPIAATFLVIVSLLAFFNSSQEGEDWITLMTGSGVHLEWLMGEGEML